MSKKSEAHNGHFVIRRIPPSSSHWRIAPPGSTSGAYRDEKSELSVDLDSENPTDSIERLKTIFKEYIVEKGIGLDYAQVEHINSALLEGRVEGLHEGKPIEDGKVLHDPIENNENHGIITGKDSKNKARLLKAAFKNILPPNQNYFK